jgi:hypothetical protein
LYTFFIDSKLFLLIFLHKWQKWMLSESEQQNTLPMSHGYERFPTLHVIHIQGIRAHVMFYLWWQTNSILLNLNYNLLQLLCTRMFGYLHLPVETLFKMSPQKKKKWHKIKIWTKNMELWDMIPHNLVYRFQHFRRSCCLHLEDRRVTPTLLPRR